MSVILFTGGGGVWQTTCLGRHSPWAETPPWAYPPPAGHCSGQYTSYWNAFLLINMPISVWYSKIMSSRFGSSMNTKHFIRIVRFYVFYEKTYIARTSINVIIMPDTDHVVSNRSARSFMNVHTVSLGHCQDLSFLKGVRGTISIC